MGRLLLLLALGLCALSVRAQSNFPITPSGLKYLITEYGEGPQARAGRTVVLHYVGKLRDGTIFDDTRKRGQPLEFRLGRGEVMAGWEEGLYFFHGGSKGILVVPASLTQGGRPLPNLPAGQEVVFEFEVLEVRPPAPSG